MKTKAKTHKPKKSVKSLLPQSKATNAYQLLADVIECIKQEPKRLDMNVWREENGTNVDSSWVDWRQKANWPACGTIGCVGGWTETLMRSRRKHSNSDAFELLLGSNEPDEWAPSLEQAVQRRRDLHDLFYPGFHNHKLAGTARYATAVIKRIQAFMKKHEKTLKARKLPK